jgi:S-methylmethionine-dependent homocysteine/selenocysteine methylase
MSRFGQALPQLGGTLFLTDSGLETTLIFRDGVELPDFAAFTLLRDEVGRQRLDSYFREHAQVAERAGAGFVLESATWRASSDWGDRLGYTHDELTEANRNAVTSLLELRDGLASDRPVVVSGCIGPRGDGYDGRALMTADQARDYHSMQVETFAAVDADLVHAMTITYPDEAIGIVRAANAAEIPVAISFTVETDGVVPDGTALGEAIDRVDEATGGGAAYFAINCAHPTHFEHVLDPGAAWTQRLRGIRANASRKSHAELDESETLDAGDPVELAAQYTRLRELLPHLTVLGGCCGTDVRHVRAIAETLTSAP